MKILSKDIKHGFVKLQVTSLDDLWYLSQIIDNGDFVTGKTTRKLKIGDNENAKSVKKTYTLEICVEKLEYSKTTSSLRILGKISSDVEDIPKGSSHTISISPDEASIIKIKKNSWLKYQLDKIEDASQPDVSKILIVVMDREQVYFALLKKSGYDVLSNFEGDISKKSVDEKEKASFYPKIISQIDEYVKRHKITNIVLASPAFFKEDLMKGLKDDSLKKKITLATCSSVGKNAIDEVLKRDEVKTVLAKDRVSQEAALVESLLSEISKQGLAVYGEQETIDAANLGAIQKVLVSDALIHKKREEDTFDILDNTLKIVDNQKGEVHIISSDHDAGKKLDGIGGIGAILRYRI